MPFRMVSGVGRGISVLDGVVSRRRERAVFRMNLGRPIVTASVAFKLCCLMLLMEIKRIM